MYWTLELASKLEDAPWPASKDELIESFKELTSFKEVGRKYNVSDNAVRKWLNKYDLPSTKEEIKKILKK